VLPVALLPDLLTEAAQLTELLAELTLTELTLTELALLSLLLLLDLLG
jgi:hypothetical protein